MASFHISMALFGLEKLFSHDVRRVIEAVHAADVIGIDQVVVTDHVVMGEQLDKYPYGKFPVPVDFPWYEPITYLASMASVTQRIRLAMGILIAPLRPAVLLAKQAATLDVLSGGRLDLGLGTGWQEEEYTASGVPFEKRLSRMEDQIGAMRALWRDAPASYTSPTLTFDRLFSRPAPIQATIPIALGIAPTDKNIELMARVADGWLPMQRNPDEYAPAIQKIHARLRELERDPKGFCIRAQMQPVKGTGGNIDLEASIAQIPPMLATGVTHVTFTPISFINTGAELPALMERMVRVKG